MGTTLTVPPDVETIDAIIDALAGVKRLLGAFPSVGSGQITVNVDDTRGDPEPFSRPPAAYPTPDEVDAAAEDDDDPYNPRDCTCGWCEARRDVKAPILSPRSVIFEPFIGEDVPLAEADEEYDPDGYDVDDAPRGVESNGEGEGAGPGRPFTSLRHTGLLWLINASVFHPRGYAFSIHVDPETGEATGWSLQGDGSEPWQFAPPAEWPAGWTPDDAFLAAKALVG